MSNLGFVESLLDSTNQFYQVALQQFEWWKETQGTKVEVTRIKQNTSYRNVFGAIASSTLPDDSSAEHFEHVVLISMNNMMKIFQKSIENLTCYDNENKLKLGDILSFSRGKQVYKWKVIDIETFSEAEGVLYQYTLGGFTEVDAGTKTV